MYDKNSLHFRGPNERFGTHEELTWGCKLGQISPRVILICNELERFIYVSNANCFNLAFVVFYIRRCGQVLLVLGKIIVTSK